MQIHPLANWAQNNSGMSELLMPLPVDCWDWTKAIALPRVPLARRLIPFRWGDSGATIARLYHGVWGAMP